MEDQNLNVKIIPPKDYLPKLAAVAAVFLSLFLLVLIISGVVEISNKIKEGRYIGQSSQYKNTISVSGEGKVLAKPDIGQVDLSVLSQTTTVVEGQNQNTQKMNKIIQAMKDAGVKEEDLETINYNVSPRYQYTSGKSEIIGYEVSQTLRVKIKDLAKTGQIISKAAELGANQVGSLNFTVDDPSKLKDEARQKAIEQAKNKAKDLAVVLGVNLGKVASFDESLISGPTYESAMNLGMGGGGDAAPKIQTGQNEITVSVSLSYEIY